MLRRPASSGPVSLEGRLGKAEPSMVASTVSRSCRSLQFVNRAFARFFAHQGIKKCFPIVMNIFFLSLGEGKKAKRPLGYLAAAVRFFRRTIRGRDGRVGPKAPIAEGGPGVSLGGTDGSLLRI